MILSILFAVYIACILDFVYHVYSSVDRILKIWVLITLKNVLVNFAASFTFMFIVNSRLAAQPNLLSSLFGNSR